MRLWRDDEGLRLRWDDLQGREPVRPVSVQRPLRAARVEIHRTGGPMRHPVQDRPRRTTDDGTQAGAHHPPIPAGHRLVEACGQAARLQPVANGSVEARRLYREENKMSTQLLWAMVIGYVGSLLGFIFLFLVI